MLITKDFDGIEFRSKEELHDHIRANKQSMYAAKMLTTKHSDAFSFQSTTSHPTIVNKEGVPIDREVNKLAVKLVANSCGIFDSHFDVHLQKSWDKTASEQGVFYHLQEHKAIFDNVISYDSKKSVERIKILGKTTDALIVNSIIDKEVNPKMFKRYKDGNVFFHSVGMLYIKGKLFLCIDSDDPEDAKEKANYDKYVSQVINREVMEQYGYFWAVAEAKAVEVSAVIFASNDQTPTLEVVEIENEPSNDTRNKEYEPLNNTQFDTEEFINGLNF